MGLSERWMDKQTMTDFFSSLNDYLSSQNKKASIYVFGGGALCLHGTREKTGDFDTATIMDGTNPHHSEFEAIKKHCLPTIGVYPNDPKFNDTFNDICSPRFKEEGINHFLSWLEDTKKIFPFDSFSEYSHLKVIVPTKEYLLASRLMDLQFTNPKTELDKIDCESLIKNMKINSENKHDFLSKCSTHPKIEIISQKLDETLSMLDPMTALNFDKYLFDFYQSQSKI